MQPTRARLPAACITEGAIHRYRIRYSGAEGIAVAVERLADEPDAPSTEGDR